MKDWMESLLPFTWKSACNFLYSHDYDPSIHTKTHRYTRTNIWRNHLKSSMYNELFFTRTTSSTMHPFCHLKPHQTIVPHPLSLPKKLVACKLHVYTNNNHMDYFYWIERVMVILLLPVIRTRKWIKVFRIFFKATCNSRTTTRRVSENNKKETF